MAKNKVSVEISVEEKAALKALTKLTKGVDNFGDETVKSVKKSNAAIDSFKGNLSAAAAVGAFKAIASGLFNVASAGLEAAASAEKIKTQLEVLTGSEERASSLFKELTEYSSSTPFQLNNIAEASAQLLSFGFSAGSVTERIAQIGEVAAGSNSDLKEVALIYGQVAAAGKLTGERLLQFQERAIPIGAALAKSLGVAESQVKDLVSSGAVGFPQFEEAFNSMSEAGGMFEGAVAKQSKTINGALSTMSDNAAILATTFGDTFSEDFADVISVVTESLKALNNTVRENKSAIQAVSGFAADYINFYTTLATDLVKVESPLDKVTQKIADSSDEIQKLLKRKKELEESKGDWGGLFDESNALSLQKLNGMLGVQQHEIGKLVAERKKLLDLKFGAKDSEDLRGAQSEYEDYIKSQQKIIASEKLKSDTVLAERKKLHLGLLQAEQDKMAMEAETRLAQDELGLTERETEIETIRYHETQKAEIAYNIALEKNKNIKDLKARELADEKAMMQMSVDTHRASAKAKMAIDKNQQLHDQQMLSLTGRTIGAAVALARKGSKEHQLLSMAQATVATYTAATQALSSPPGPPYTIPLAALITAAGLKNVSQIASQSFATGGVIGGFAGATNGNDNTQRANLRQGEMVLNAGQQRQLFDVANGSQVSNNQGSSLELTTIVQIDEREIARSVRNQSLEGFKVA